MRNAVLSASRQMQRRDPKHLPIRKVQGFPSKPLEQDASAAPPTPYLTPSVGASPSCAQALSSQRLRKRSSAQSPRRSSGCAASPRTADACLLYRPRLDSGKAFVLEYPRQHLSTFRLGVIAAIDAVPLASATQSIERRRP